MTLLDYTSINIKVLKAYMIINKSKFRYWCLAKIVKYKKYYRDFRSLYPYLKSYKHPKIYEKFESKAEILLINCIKSRTI